MKMDETCKEKAGFICRYETFQFEVMPRCRHILEAHGGTCEPFGNVFVILRNKGLRLRIKKCSFMQPIVELLGHVVDKNGVHAAEQTVEKVRDAIPRTTRKELPSFLGLSSYYHGSYQDSQGLQGR